MDSHRPSHRLRVIMTFYSCRNRQAVEIDAYSSTVVSSLFDWPILVFYIGYQLPVYCRHPFLPIYKLLRVFFVTKLGRNWFWPLGVMSNWI